MLRLDSSLTEVNFVFFIRIEFFHGKSWIINGVLKVIRVMFLVLQEVYNGIWCRSHAKMLAKKSDVKDIMYFNLVPNSNSWSIVFY